MLNNIENLMEQALQAAVSIDRATAKGDVFAEIAYIYLKSGQPSRCLEILQEALRIADSLKHPEDKAALLAWLAGIYVQAGYIPLSRELFTRSRLLAGAAETTALKADALKQIVHEYLDAGLQSEAEAIIHDLHEIIVNPESGLDKTSELICLARIYLDAGLSAQSRQLLDEASRTAALTKDPWFKTEYYTSIAELYTEMKENLNSVKELESAAISAARLDKMSRPYFLLRMAQTYILLDLIIRARDILTAALSIVNQEEMAFSKCGDILTIAEMLAHTGEYTQTNALLAQVKEITENIEDIKDKITGLITLARSLDRLDQVKEATVMAIQALDLCSSIENQRTLLFLLGDIALLFVELQQPEKAYGVIHQITEIASNPRIKTSGLGTTVSDMCEAHQEQMALLLAGVIHEPDARAKAFISLAKNLLIRSER